MCYVYILRCADDSLYTGWTVDLEKRLQAHNSGTASKCTRARLPVELVYSRSAASKSEAMKLESRIKMFSREKKLKLIRNEIEISVPSDTDRKEK